MVFALLAALACMAATTPSVAQPEWMMAEAEYFREGRYSDALRVIENVRAHLRATGRAESREFIALCRERGVVLNRGLGDYARAASAFQEADAICIRVYGADDGERVDILTRQCEVVTKLRRYADAAVFGRAAVRLSAKIHGAEHAETAKALHYLALPLAELPDTAEAETVLRRVLEIRRKIDGEQSYWTGLAWHNLGVFELQMGRLDQAREMIVTAQRISAKFVSPQSPDGIGAQRNLIRVALEGNHEAEAMERAEKLFATELTLFRNSFPSLDENGRLNMKSQFEPGRWFCTLGTAEPVARALLQTKAMTLDHMFAHPATPAVGADPFAHLLRPENAALGLRVYSPENARPPAKADASLPGQALPATAPRGKGGPLALYSVTAQQVCAALPANAVVIEFTRYKHYVGRFADEYRYGAVVFRPMSDHRREIGEFLQWIPLGSAEAIDREIGGLLESAAESLAGGTLGARLRTLHELIWAPIAKAVPVGTENVFLCPDGQLCFLPFSGLLDPQGRFLADRHLVMYLSTARDLFRADAAEKIDTDRFVIFAAPTFGRHVAASSEVPTFRYREAEVRSLEKLHLVDLPGARREAEMLRRLAGGRHLRPAVFTGDEASKVNVRSLENPRVVHFATHGFILPPVAADVASNPMDRSGLALAGAQTSLAAMASGRMTVSSEEDGLLTARQVAQLPWQGTWLVTLSACNTGRGEARDGESVLGLRRGFIAAGVENLLLSLWKISDDETVGFMRDFYARALETSDAATAMALTQRDWLGRLRKERGIAAAVSIAGAFVLNASGRLPLPAETNPTAPQKK